MAEDKPKSEPSEENVQMPIDPDEAAEAVKEINEAMVILPKKRFGCLGRFAKYGAVLFVLLAAFVYWNFLRTPRLVISKETTYITEPLTSDGTRVDYFAALERDFYPPEMKTDDNGYRMIVRALGDAVDEWQENESNHDTEARAVQVYEKLGLDPAIEPTMTYMETREFLLEYGAREGLDEEQVRELDAKVYQPWTLDDLPMMEPWLEEAGPVLDLVEQAVRRPTFFFPLLRPHELPTLVELALAELQRTRSFARMLQARAHYRIGIGDIDGAIDDVITCEHLGRHVERQGMIVSRLVGIALQGIAASVGIAAIRESQPTEEQLQRLVDELNALPPRPNMDRAWLAERYYTLDTLQAVAMGDESLAGLFSAGEGIEEYKLAIAACISVDWNIVMRRVNELYDDLGGIHVWQRPKLLSPGNLFIGVRSQRVGDLMAGLFMPSLEATGEAIRRTDCVGNLRRITLAMLIYERQHGTLPPVYTVDAAGNPLHSWRVLLLPYLGEEELFGKLRLDEPWDSQHNRRFHHAAIAIYQCPSAELKPGQTTYSVVVGEKTAFQAAEGKSLDDLGMNLMLVVERAQSVCWMNPTSELAESVAFEGINRREGDVDGIGSHHPGGVDVGLRDGSVRFISKTIELPLLQGLLDGTAEECRY
jgi:uncharacterized protein DUF1559